MGVKDDSRSEPGISYAEELAFPDSGRSQVLVLRWVVT